MEFSAPRCAAGDIPSIFLVPIPCLDVQIVRDVTNVIANMFRAHLVIMLFAHWCIDCVE